MARLSLIAAALMAACLPAFGQAASPNLAGANDIEVQVGTGKVSLNCPANVTCSRVDASGVVRFGHRFDPAWSFEVSYSRIDADWGFLVYNYSAEYTGFGVGAAYRVPLADSVALKLRGGIAANELKLQPAVDLGKNNPGTISTRSVKPYVGLGLSWQFAQHWQASLGLDLTRADLRDSPSSPKQSVTVQTAGVGIGFSF